MSCFGGEPRSAFRDNNPRGSDGPGWCHHHHPGQLREVELRSIVVPSYSRKDGKLLKLYGAGDGVRTRDVQLGKLAFYH